MLSGHQLLEQYRIDLSNGTHECHERLWISIGSRLKNVELDGGGGVIPRHLLYAPPTNTLGPSSIFPQSMAATTHQAVRHWKSLFEILHGSKREGGGKFEYAVFSIRELSRHL